jgi:hypothetical protein
MPINHSTSPATPKLLVLLFIYNFISSAHEETKPAKAKLPPSVVGCAVFAPLLLLSHTPTHPHTHTHTHPHTHTHTNSRGCRVCFPCSVLRACVSGVLCVCVSGDICLCGLRVWSCWEFSFTVSTADCNY